MAEGGKRPAACQPGAARHAQHIVAVIQAAARIVPVRLGAYLSTADVGVQRLWPDVQHIERFRSRHPDHFHFLC
jgi:hypothetical protein